MKKLQKNDGRILGMIACCIPFVFILIPVFRTNIELYNMIVFDLYLSFGSFTGAVFGVVSYILNRKIKRRSTDVLAVLSLLIFIGAMIFDYFFQRTLL